jgi:DNA mismatch repair ATPase MutS
MGFMGAAHCHEFTDLADTKQAVDNCNAAAMEWNEEIIFLHEISCLPRRRVVRNIS